MTSKLIEIISKRDKLLDFMEKYGITGLIFATEEQLIEYITEDLGMNLCFVMGCGWYESDYGCTCPGIEKWYQCPLEPEPTAEDFMTEEELKEYHGGKTDV